MKLKILIILAVICISLLNCNQTETLIKEAEFNTEIILNKHGKITNIRFEKFKFEFYPTCIIFKEYFWFFVDSKQKFNVVLSNAYPFVGGSTIYQYICTSDYGVCINSDKTEVDVFNEVKHTYYVYYNLDTANKTALISLYKNGSLNYKMQLMKLKPHSVYNFLLNLKNQ